MGIVRNIQNDDVYRYLGEGKFKNLRTLNEGAVDDEAARKVFRVNLEATEMINENPLIEKMINILQLRFAKKEENGVEGNTSD